MFVNAGYTGPKFVDEDRQRIDDLGDQFAVYDANKQGHILSINKEVTEQDVWLIFEVCAAAYQEGVKVGKSEALKTLEPLVEELKV